MNDLRHEAHETRWQATRRRAGCLVGCLMEPLVIVWLMLGSALAGWLWKRRRDERRDRAAEQNGSQDD